MKTIQALLVAQLGLLSAVTFAQEQALEQAANDPTASLMNVQVADWYTADYHNLSGEEANSVVLRSAVPFTLAEQNHIFRVTARYVTDGPSGSSGIADMTVFDLVTFDQDWGRWGVGAVGLLPTGGEKRGAENWGLGPAFGFVSQFPGMLLGVFNQNIFSLDAEQGREDVNVSVFQPIFNKSLGNGWALGTSEMSVTYDWENNRWASLPIGLKLVKLVRFGELPVQISGEYEYNLEDSRIVPENTFRVTAKFIFPGPG